MRAELRRYRRHLARELDNVSIYRDLADVATGEHREILLQLAEAEARHAGYWEARLKEMGAGAPRPEDHRPRVRARSLSRLGRWFGVRRIVPLLERLEAAELSRYASEPGGSPAMASDERVHAELVGTLAPAWRSRASNAVRAAIFGVNDGLVSNFALVAGMVGGNADASTVLLAGVAGLVAGAGSMAAGEYISVRSQRELVQAEAGLGTAEMAAIRDRDPAAFELLVRARGVGPQQPVELDLEVVGSPLAAAAWSFVAFGTGAAVPVAPFLFTSGTAAIVIAGALAAVALFLVGAATSLFTNRPVLRSGGRQLAIAAAAAGGTYLVGRAVGAGLS